MHLRSFNVHFGMIDAEIERHGMEVSFNGVISLLNVMKINQWKAFKENLTICIIISSFSLMFHIIMI
jgi:hypothetical protein